MVGCLLPLASHHLHVGGLVRLAGRGGLVRTSPIGKAGAVAVREPAPKRRRRVSLGLRARVTVGFMLAGLVVSVGLSFIAYFLARAYLLEQRDTVARRQAFVNARLVRDVLRDPDAQPGILVGSLRTEGGGFALLQFSDRWYSQNVGFNQQALPESLREGVLLGSSGRQRYRFDDAPYVAVGAYLPEVDAAYFEVFSMAGVERTLGVLGTSLAVAATITTLSAAGAGWWASRRVLRPVSRVADAASELAQGGLDTRLEEETDPDLDRLVTSFNEMADAVQDRIEREVRFASDVSHELRSPITALTAAIEVLDARRDELSARSQQALDVVVSQVRRFDQMVLDLLEISRLDAGAADLHAEPVLLGDVACRIARRNGFDRVPVIVKPPWDEHPVEVDKRRLERILANLLGNAEQHAGGAVCVCIENGTPGMARIVVEDAGPGVSTSEKSRIFERFARGTAARHRVGTGLGLALVAEHAGLHGGRAWVEDRQGGGSRFVVELPAGIR
jgi:two-component system, OmpR family, sensor histidine kinase MtrB